MKLITYPAGKKNIRAAGGRLLSGKGRIKDVLCLMVLMLMYEKSMATCSAANSTLSLSGDIIAQRDAPIGTVLATGTLNTAITCNAGGQNLGLDGSWIVNPASTNSDFGATTLTNVRATNYPGIGIRWLNVAPGGPGVWSSRAINAWGLEGRGFVQVGTQNMRDTFEFIKTGNIASGVMPSRVFQYVHHTPVSANVRNLALYRITLPATTVRAVACSVTQTAIPVSLGHDIPLSRFTGVGSRSDNVDFSIPLSCNDGARVNFRLDGDASSGVLRLNSVTGSATGIGVEVMYKGVAVPFGTRILDGTAVSSGTYNVNFIARYLQTSGTVTPGPANATATFTMTYL